MTSLSNSLLPMMNSHNSISPAPPTTSVSISSNPSNPSNPKLVPCEAYSWKGQYYSNLEQKRRDHLTHILEAHNVENLDKIVDIIVHDIEAIHSRGLVQGWKCPDGAFFIKQEDAEKYLKELEEIDTLKKLSEKYNSVYK